MKLTPIIGPEPSGLVDPSCAALLRVDNGLRATLQNKGPGYPRPAINEF
jgi:hypothetical protein